MHDPDTHLFIDIILSEGATYLYGDEVDGDRFEYYTATSGRKVSICVSDECLSTNTAKAYLRQLGLESLIERLFID
jgi:hypothetical protein